MEGIEIVMTRRSGEKGQLFGSVTTMDIEEGLAAQGFKISRRKIQLGSPLKSVGEFDVPVRLHREVTVTVKVKVEAEGEPEQAAPRTEKPRQRRKPAEAKPRPKRKPQPKRSRERA